MRSISAGLGRLGRDAVAIELLGVAVGAGMGVIASSYREPANSSVDVGAYQNYGIIAGAVVGTAACLLWLAFALLMTRVRPKAWPSRSRPFVVSTAVTGGLAGLLTYVIVSSSGVSHGMLERAALTAVFDGLVAAAISAAAGLGAGWVIARVRGYD